jgi:hypothetical protein
MHFRTLRYDFLLTRVVAALITRFILNGTVFMIADSLPEFCFSLRQPRATNGVSATGLASPVLAGQRAVSYLSIFRRYPLRESAGTNRPDQSLGVAADQHTCRAGRLNARSYSLTERTRLAASMRVAAE